MFKKGNKNKGFTLVELIVALAIFTIVAVVAVGALVRITGLNRRAQSMQASMSNIAFALDSMSREIRVGSQYSCADPTSLNISPAFFSGGSCVPSSPGDTSRVIIFGSSATAPDGDGESCRLLYAYAFVPNSDGTFSLKKAKQSECDQGFDGSSFTPVLDDSNVHLTDYRLGVYDGSADGKHSSVFVRLVGYSGAREQDRNHFDIQTFISQRIND